MNKLLLLPSSKYVPPELQLEFGRVPTGLVPVDSRPVFEHIVNSYLKEGFEAVISVFEGAELVEDFLRRRPDLHTSAFNVGNTRSLGETILKTLDSCSVMPDQLVINFADAFMEEPLTLPDAIAYAVLPERFRWTTFAVDSDNHIEYIEEKDTEKSENIDWKVFVGVFSFSRVDSFVSILKKHVEAERENLDPFYKALIEYFHSLPATERQLFLADMWHDFGHLDTYYASKKSFFLNRRFFNSIRIDRDKGSIRKTSTDTKKFLEEIYWYLKLPKSLQHIAPRVFDFSLDFEKPFVELEFYGYPALNDLYLFGNFNVGLWNQILIAIKSLLTELMKYRFVPDREDCPESQDLLSVSLREMYEEKTRQRLSRIFEDRLFEVFQSEELRINGKKSVSLAEALHLMPTVAEKLGIYQNASFCIIHGDLCLSNILFDQRNNIVRVIDPRGRFGRMELYGDIRYDLAKLMHSFEGNYDFLVNNLFEIKTTKNEVRLEIFMNENHHKVKSLFDSWMTKNWKQEIQAVRFIESMLFLSMVPLHADNANAQKAFLATGLEIFSELAAEL